MKRKISLALVLFFASVVSSFANAEAPATIDAGKSLYAGVSAEPTGSGDGTLVGKMSKGVYMGWSCDANGYILTSQHVSGNRSFGSSHDATAIYRHDSVPQDPSGVSGANINSGYFSSGWTAM